MHSLGVIFLVVSLAALSISAFVTRLAGVWTDNAGLRSFAAFLLCLVGMGLSGLVSNSPAIPNDWVARLASYTFETICMAILPRVAYGVGGSRVPRKVLVPALALCAGSIAVKCFITAGAIGERARFPVAIVDTAYVIAFVTLMRARRGLVRDAVTARILARFRAITFAFIPFLLVACVGIPGLPRLMNEYLALSLYLLSVSAVLIAEAGTWLSTLAPGTASTARLDGHVKASGLAPAEIARMRAGLTERQREIASMIVAGLSAKEIATRLGISPKTAENHTYALYRKFGARSRIQFYELYRSEPDTGGETRV